MGLYFEELTEGMSFDHPFTRTVTEYDNVSFSLLTMNPQPLHIDFDFAAITRLEVRLRAGDELASEPVMLTIRGDREQAKVADVITEFDVYAAVERANRIGLQEECALLELGAHLGAVDARPLVEKSLCGKVRLIDQRDDFRDVFPRCFAQILLSHPSPPDGNRSQPALTRHAVAHSLQVSIAQIGLTRAI